MKTKSYRVHATPGPESGLGLIELMVGLALGLLVTLVITQVWGTFESQRNRTSSSSSAQENSLIALTQIEQGVRNAGSGMSSGIFACSNIFSYYDDGTTVSSPAPGIPTTRPYPVFITDGGTTGSDVIEVTRASSMTGAIDARVTKQDPQHNSVINLSNVNNFTEVPNPCSAAEKQKHLAVCTHGNQCVVFQVTSVLQGSLKLNANKGQCGPFNPNATCYNAGGACASWPEIDTNDKCFMIDSFVVQSFSVNNARQLQVVTSTPGSVSNAAILVDNVVSLQAQYGVSSAVNVQNVSNWVDATGTWAALDEAETKRIKAIRLVVVARSSKMEGADVTSTCTNNAGVNNGPCAWEDTATDPAPLIDLSGDPNWKRFRYRVYQTIIPLRNVIWGT